MTDKQRINDLEKRVGELEEKVRLLRGEYKTIGVRFESREDLKKGFGVLNKNRINFNMLGFESMYIPEEGEKYLMESGIKYKKYEKEEPGEIIVEIINSPEAKKEREEFFAKYGKKSPGE